MYQKIKKEEEKTGKFNSDDFQRSRHPVITTKVTIKDFGFVHIGIIRRTSGKLVPWTYFTLA